jgi:flagellar basal body P-ring formation protein FlgA
MRHAKSAMKNDISRRRAQSFTRILCALSSTAFALCVSQAFATEIEFRPLASVTTSTVQLKDVAIVNGADPALVARLERVVVAPAPAPGRRARLDFATIRSRLEANGFADGNMQFSGSSVVIVASMQPAAQATRVRPKFKPVISPAQVRRAEQIMTEAVRGSIRAHNRDAASMFVEVVMQPSDVPAVFAGAAESFEIGAINPRVTGPQTVNVHYVDGEGKRTFSIQCAVSQRPRVPVVTHSVAVGEVLHESDLEWKQVDSAEGLITRVDAIVDKEAKKALHTDEPIHADDVRSVPLVRAGDIVTGVWKSGGIRITGQFKARNDGGLGDIVTLVKLTGRDQLQARVSDVHQAEIVGANQASPGRDDGADDLERSANRTALFRRSAVNRIPRAPRPLPPATTETETQLVGGESR